MWENNHEKIIEGIKTIQKGDYVLSVSALETDNGFEYKIFLIDPMLLTDLGGYKDWNNEGSSFSYKNKYGVIADIKPNMSWQVWWEIPLNKIKEIKTIEINVGSNKLNNKQKVIELVNQNGFHLTNVPKDLKNDLEIVKLAVQRSGEEVLDYVSKGTKSKYLKHVLTSSKI